MKLAVTTCLLSLLVAASAMGQPKRTVAQLADGIECLAILPGENERADRIQRVEQEVRLELEPEASELRLR